MESLTSGRSEKRLYTTPQLTVHGSLEELTKQNKDWGVGDAYTFQNQPTTVTS